MAFTVDVHWWRVIYSPRNSLCGVFVKVTSLTSGRVDHSLISLTDDDFSGISTTYIVHGLCFMQIGMLVLDGLRQRLFDHQLLQNSMVRNIEDRRKDDSLF